MPNWCETNIRITLGENLKKSQKEKAKKQFAELLRKITENNPNGDFLNILYPIPESLKITSGSATEDGIAVIMSTKYNDHTLIDRIFNYPWVAKEKRIKDRDDLLIYLVNENGANLEEGQMAIDNIAKYGCKSWYEWCTQNWGSKWDLSSMEVEEYGEAEIQINSQTAWTPPLAGITKISEEYNLLNFFVEYKEPGCGFQGEADIEDGNCNDNCGEYDYSEDELDDNEEDE